MDWASPGDVEQAVERWTDGQIECRAYGHNWRPASVTHRPGVYTVYQRCPRCRNRRRQPINENGYALAPWSAAYQDGYLLKGMGRLGTDGRAVLKIATLRTAVIIEEPDDGQ
jgi:hypothetical protein